MLPLALLLLQAAPSAIWRPPATPQVRIAARTEGRLEGNYRRRRLSSRWSHRSPTRSVPAIISRSTCAFASICTRARCPSSLPTTRRAARFPPLRALASGPSTTTTNWQTFHRIFAPQPGAAQVRARIRADGHGEILLSDLEFRPRQIDPYQTGALISQIYPRNRRGLVIESNLNIVNPEMISKDDRDGDGKWALILVDLDRLSEPEQKGVDWRTKFEYRPNEIYWSDGAVLKSDSVLADRAPDANRALHFRTRLHPGSYHVILNDPGRAVAVSRDGKTWKRYAGGEEADLGMFDAPAGQIEFWIDACYRDPVSAGPAYFDYIRVFPADDAQAADRLFRAARQNPPPAPHGSAEEWRVEVTAHAPVNPAASRWPVRCGLPIPRGELGSAANTTVLDAAGAPIPSQARAMATWPDGTVKWLYLDFTGDFSSAPSSASPSSTATACTSSRPAGRVGIERTARGIEVDTGAVRFLVPSAHFGIVEDVRAGGKQVQPGPLTATITEAGGKTWRALDLPVAKLEIEQAGPLHTVILAETALAPSGKQADGFAHRARIHAYAGSPLVEVDYFVANTDARPKLQVRSIGLQLAPQSAVETTGADPRQDRQGAGHRRGGRAAARRQPAGRRRRRIPRDVSEGHPLGPAGRRDRALGAGGRRLRMDPGRRQDAPHRARLRRIGRPAAGRRSGPRHRRARVVHALGRLRSHRHRGRQQLSGDRAHVRHAHARRHRRPCRARLRKLRRSFLGRLRRRHLPLGQQRIRRPGRRHHPLRPHRRPRRPAAGPRLRAALPGCRHHPLQQPQGRLGRGPAHAFPRRRRPSHRRRSRHASRRLRPGSDSLQLLHRRAHRASRARAASPTGCCATSARRTTSGRWSARSAIR